MTAQETNELARQGEKLDALSYAIKEIKDMLTKRDDMCGIHSETIARHAEKHDSLDREVTRIKTEDLDKIIKRIEKLEDNNVWLWRTLVVALVSLATVIIPKLIGLLAACKIP